MTAVRVELAMLFVVAGCSSPIRGTDAGVGADSTASDAWACPGSFGPDAHCYVFVSAGATWANASSDCAAMGGHLVTVGSTAEQDFAWTLSMGSAWIGATDVGSEAAWRWTTGEPWTPRWGAAQPDNAGAGENCAALWPGFTGLWADVSCDSMLPYVCEWS